jgi:Matrixin
VLRALVIGIAIVVAGADTPRAQRAPLPRWASHAVIPVWLDARASPPGADLLVDRAMATWTRAAGGRLTLQKTASRDAALIRVRFAQADGIYGETAPRVDRTTGLIGSAEVLIAGDVAGDPMQQRIVIYLTALHELGHALGLPHTNVFDDIMYSFRRPDDGERYFGAYRRKLSSSDDIGTERATGLSPADVAALQNLYDR